MTKKKFKHPRKLKMIWLGPYMIMHITDASTVKLQKLDGTYVTGMVNESLLKPYYDGHDNSWLDCIMHKKKNAKN